MKRQMMGWCSVWWVKDFWWKMNVGGNLDYVWRKGHDVPLFLYHLLRHFHMFGISAWEENQYTTQISTDVQKRSGSLGRRDKGELKCEGSRSDNCVTGRFCSLCWPLWSPMISFLKPAKLMGLPALVSMATTNHREMSQLLRDKLFSFPLATERLSFFFCVLVCSPPTRVLVDTYIRAA